MQLRVAGCGEVGREVVGRGAALGAIVDRERAHAAGCSEAVDADLLVRPAADDVRLER
jgi:hypothetical protein